MCSVAEGDLELPIFPLPSPVCWNYRHAPLYTVYGINAGLGMEP